MAIPYVESSLRKRLYNESCSLRILVVHLLTSTSSYDRDPSTHITLQVWRAMPLSVSYICPYRTA